jgi:ABC-type sulfate transport system permease component
MKRLLGLKRFSLFVSTVYPDAQSGTVSSKSVASIRSLSVAGAILFEESVNRSNRNRNIDR